MKRIVMFTLSLLLILSMVGCGGSTNSTEPTTTNSASSDKVSPETTKTELKQANLVFYALGDKPKDFDAVAAKLNEKSNVDLKCTVDTKFISWADFSTKYPLVFASGEKFDMIYSANWSYYNSQSVKNGFMELTEDLLSKYAPNSWSQIPKEAWQQTEVKGKRYMIPNWQDAFNHSLIVIRGDLREKYGLPEIKTVADYENYLTTIAAKDKSILPYDGGSDFDAAFMFFTDFLQPQGLIVLPVTNYVIKMTDPKAEPINMTEMPEYKTFLKKMVEFNKAGVWSKNALNNKVANKDSFLNGKSASAIHNMESMATTWKQTMDSHPDWKPEIYDVMEDFPTMRISYTQNGMSIFANSENPERALMWIDKVRFDKSYYNLMMYGIEGKHWKDEGDGKMSSTPASLDYSGFSNWGFVNKPSMLTPTDRWPGWDNVLKKWSERTVKDPLNFMAFDDSNVKNEMAALNNTIRKYERILQYGFHKDPEKLVADYESKLNAAGRDKVLQEWIKQRDAQLAK